MKHELELILQSDLSIDDKVKAICKLKKYPKEGLAFCVHHDVCIEYCTSFEERTMAILTNKNPSEHLTRFLNFTYIPNDFLSVEIRESYAKLDETYAKLDEARVRLDEARAKWNEARAKWNEADKINLLNKLAPENTWNGKNIWWE